MELMEIGKACSRSGEAGVEWLTPEQRSKRREQRHALFAEGREVASDPCERGRGGLLRMRFPNVHASPGESGNAPSSTDAATPRTESTWLAMCLGPVRFLIRRGRHGTCVVGRCCRGVRPACIVSLGYTAATRPPSTAKMAPWTKEASSLARYTTAEAISSGVPGRRAGVACAKRS